MSNRVATARSIGGLQLPIALAGLVGFLFASRTSKPMAEQLGWVVMTGGVADTPVA